MSEQQNATVRMILAYAKKELEAQHKANCEELEAIAKAHLEESKADRKANCEELEAIAKAHLEESKADRKAHSEELEAERKACLEEIGKKNEELAENRLAWRDAFLTLAALVATNENDDVIRILHRVIPILRADIPSDVKDRLIFELIADFLNVPDAQPRPARVSLD